MSHANFLEKLLDGVAVEWKRLGEVCKIETGKLNANAAVEGGAFMFGGFNLQVQHPQS